MRVYYKQKFSDFVPPDMGCEQPRTDAEEITFSVMREMLYFDTRFERKNYCERYTRELESAAEAGCGYAWLLLFRTTVGLSLLNRSADCRGVLQKGGTVL